VIGTSLTKAAVSLIAVLLFGAVLAAALLAQRGEWVGRLKEALGISTSMPPPDAAATEYRRRRLASFRADPAPADIVLLGDSHIENGEWMSLLAGRIVLNRGIGWDTSQDVLDRLDEVIARKPRIVLIHIGTVDLRYGRDPATVARNIREIAGRLRQAGIRAYVQSVLPVAAGLRETTNGRVRAVNDTLRADPDFVDLHPILVTDGALQPAMTTDGVHLSGPAYALWARRIAGVLDSPSR
jgi:lysophospholipase L1-like esterase